MPVDRTARPARLAALDLEDSTSAKGQGYAGEPPVTNAGDGEDGVGLRRDTRRRGSRGVVAQPSTPMHRCEATGVRIAATGRRRAIQEGRENSGARTRWRRRTRECVRCPGWSNNRGLRLHASAYEPSRPAAVTRHDGARDAPRPRPLIGFPDVHAVHRRVEARKPAFGLAADRLLVLQVLVRGRVHREDDQ